MVKGLTSNDGLMSDDGSMCGKGVEGLMGDERI